MAYVRLSLCALLIACDPAHPADAGTDAAVSTVDPALEVGTGESGFASFEEGETLSLYCGTQGAQHVWIALRTQGIDPRGTILDLELTLDEGGDVVSQSFVVRWSLMPVPGQDYAEVYGLTLVVPEPDRVIDQDLTLRVQVTSMDGTVLERERDVRVAWAPEAPCAG